MGHYDNCRDGYCPKCGAAPGNMKNGVCEFCAPATPARKGTTKEKAPMPAAKHNEVQLGDRVRDMVTKFEGIAIGVTTWLNGCRRITIQPETLDKEGKIRDAQTFDEPQLEVTKPGKVQVNSYGSQAPTVPAARTGGPAPEPVRGGNVKR